MRRAAAAALLALAAATAGAQDGATQEAAARGEPVRVTVAELFDAGLAARARGEARAAARAFRLILAADPSLVRVRLELARALFEAGDFEESRREFFAVLSGDVPDPVRRNVLAFLRAIDARSGFDWSLTASLRPNLGRSRRYASDEIELDFLGERRTFTLNRRDPPDVVLDVTATAELQRDAGTVGGQPAVAYLGGFVAIEDAPGAVDDDHLAGLRGGLRVAWPRTTAAAGPVASARWLGGDPFETRVGVEGSLRHRLERGVTLFAGAAAQAVDDRFSDARDGAAVRGRAGLARSFGGRGSVGAALSYERFEADATFESYGEAGAELFGDADLGRGLRADAALRLRRLDYDATAPLFVEARSDEEAAATLRLTAQTVYVFGRFAPFVELGATRQRSSIDAFGYDELTVGFGFARAL